MTDKNMKNALRMVLQLLINIVIVLLLLQVFTQAYNFSYKVFTDSAMNPNSTKEIEFVIEPDSSTVEIVDALVEQGLVADKYVMIAKIYLSSYHGKMMPGIYTLSPAMSEDTILKAISRSDEEEE